MDMAQLLDEAQARGFTINFAFEGAKLRCPETGDCFAPEELQLVHSQAVDMGTDPGDDATLYLIEAANGRKGYLLVADSFHADPRKAAFIDKLLRSRTGGDVE